MKLSELFSRVESDTGKLIVFYLRRVGTATVEQIRDTLNLSLSRTLSTLQALGEKEVITQLETSAQERYALKQIQL